MRVGISKREIAGMFTDLLFPMTRVKHIAFFKFKPTCTAGDIADVWRIIEDLPRQIPGILGLTWGREYEHRGTEQGLHTQLCHDL